MDWPSYAGLLDDLESLQKVTWKNNLTYLDLFKFQGQTQEKKVIKNSSWWSTPR